MMFKINSMKAVIVITVFFVFTRGKRNRFLSAVDILVRKRLDYLLEVKINLLNRMGLVE